MGKRKGTCLLLLAFGGGILVGILTTLSFALEPVETEKTRDGVAKVDQGKLEIVANAESLFSFFSSSIDVPLFRYRTAQGEEKQDLCCTSVSNLLGWVLFRPQLEHENDRWNREALVKLFARYLRRVPDCLSTVTEGARYDFYMVPVVHGIESVLYLTGAYKARMYLQLCGSRASISTLAGWDKLLQPDPCLAEKGAIPEIGDSYKRYTLVAVWTALFGVPWMRLAAIHFLQALHKKEFETAGEWVWWWLQNWRKFKQQVSPDERPPEAVTLELMQLFCPPDENILPKLQEDIKRLREQLKDMKRKGKRKK